MTLIELWLFAYALPAFLAACWIKLFSKQEGGSPKNILVIHAVLLGSIVATQSALYARGLAFPWPGEWSLALYVASAALATLVLGRLGLLYGASALVQQLTLLSIAYLLLPAFPLWAVVLLVVPLFVFCHDMTGVPHWRTRLLLISLWGVASILLFAYARDVFLIAALHTLFGTALISRKILFPEYKL
jgi:hypothetical protein